MKKLILILCLANFTTFAQTTAKPKAKQKKETVKETIVQPDRKASYVGGSDAMDKFIIANLKSPAILKTDTTIKTRTVFLKFMLDKTGKVTNVTVMKGIKHCPQCSDEAIRVVSLMPNWNPAIENNEAKDSWFNLPINFNKD